MAICHFRKQQMKSLFVRVLVRFNSPIQSSFTLIIKDPYLHHSHGSRPILTRRFPSQTLILTEETKIPMYAYCVFVSFLQILLFSFSYVPFARKAVHKDEQRRAQGADGVRAVLIRITGCCARGKTLRASETITWTSLWAVY
ncbi:hypothetical protein CXB51_018387 [Gossypium anomalum]|uniref:Transmembrane protein n=1 Tax=Gossypium anomalum TaxID=47600 RepID=A0A8J6CYK7_9ROSI|nr:hypothetical protein CXB51_018387 [Gossypium anomalum]